MCYSHNLEQPSNELLQSLSEAECGGFPSQVQPPTATCHDTQEPSNSLGSDSQLWRAVCCKAIRNVVVIKFCHTRSFDGEAAGSGEATGFVIDVDKGYILTNRHVAGPGPFWGTCIFDSQEETPCQPVYIDPVHDFAFLSYDPTTIKHLCIDGLPLNSKKATVGLPILVVGNDAAERISIISGTISRVDRNAPDYEGSYGDLNVNYYQANLNLSGGISGSPALTSDGSVVGLVSGGGANGESICFLLPLWPVLNALAPLREGTSVPRGDIQCQFLCRPFHECRRLGLSPEREELFRAKFKGAGGPLVVETVLSTGPASGKVMVGDILLEIERELLLHFADMESIFNAHVGTKVGLTLLRDGEVISVNIRVTDLHRITPRRLLRFGEFFCCHDVSYLAAVSFGAPRRGVYVAESAEPFMIGDGDAGWIIQKVAGQELSNLDEFLQILLRTQRGQKITVTYAHLENLQSRKTDVLTLDAPKGITVAVRDDRTGIWRGPTLLLPSLDQVAKGVQFMPKSNIVSPSDLAEVVKSLVHVESRAYVSLDGFPPTRKQGMGVVVDATIGLIVVCRSVIPHKACDVTITFGSYVAVKGRGVFWHPQHYYVVIQYDPSLLCDQAATAKLSSRRVSWGEEARFVGFTLPDRILHGDAQTGAATIGGAITEDQYGGTCRFTNVDLVGASTPLGPLGLAGGSGLLVGPDGSVLALWFPFFTGLRGAKSCGIRTPGVLAVISELGRGIALRPQIFPAELVTISLATASALGVPAEVINQAAEAHDHAPQLYQVRKKTCGLGNDADQLLEGDIIVSIQGKTCTNMSDFDISCTREARIVRDGFIQSVKIIAIEADGLETSRCVEFCGASIQRPPLAVRRSMDDIPSEVYVSHVAPGSPAERYSLSTKSFITMVNGELVHDIDSFVNIVARRLGETRNHDCPGFTIVAITVTGTVKLGLRGNPYFPLVDCIYD